MKFTFGQLFKAGLAVGLGYELGRIAPLVVTRLLSKKTVEELKERYRQGMQKAEADGKNIRLVDHEFRK